MSQTKTLRQRIEAGEVLVALRGDVTMNKSQLAETLTKGKYDYIWIDGPLRVAESAVCFDRSHADDPTLYPSDHAGVRADLEL